VKKLVALSAALCALVLTALTHAATIDVCATCTYT